MEVELLKAKNELLKRCGLIRNILVLFVFLTAIWAVYIYVTPVVYKEDYIASSYNQRGEYTYTAPVTLANPLYATGSRLEMGKPAYFFSVSPTVDMTFTYYLEASDSANVDIDIMSDIVATSQESGKVYWQKSFPLESSSPLSLEENGDVIHKFTLDVPDIQAQVKSLQNQIGYSQGTLIEVITTVSYDGNINGRAVEDSEEFSFPLTISNSYYQIPEELELSNTSDFYMTRSVTRTAGMGELKTSLSLLVFFLILLLLTGFVGKMEMTDPEHIKKLDTERENSKFDDWVSMGELPSNISLPEVKVKSLQDLVDIAADMDARVIRDSEKGVYFVIKDGTLYHFSQ